VSSRVHGILDARPFVAPSPVSESDTRDPESRVREAVEEGRAQGFAQGIKQGRQAAVKEANARLENLLKTLADLSTLRERMIRAAEQDVVRLAAKIAGLVVREKIETDGEEGAVALRALRTALEEFSKGDGFTIRCHPKDEEILRRQMGFLSRAAGSASTEAITLVSDPSVSPGGCVVLSEAGEVDVTVETQLQVIEHELLSRS
jgi:flagellar assembly protein FliH